MTKRIEKTVRLRHPRGGELALDLRYTGELREAVVFLHGLGSVRNGEKAQALADACARRGWTFAAMDCRGHGESTGLLEDLQCTGLMEDVAVLQGFLQGQGISRVHVVGPSMGGWTAARWSITQPHFVATLGLIAPALHFPHGLWQRLTSEQQSEWRRTGRLHVKTDWLDTDLKFGLIEDAQMYPVAQLAAAWKVPTLIFHGMADDVVSYQSMLQVVEQVKKTPIEVRLWRAGDHRLVEHKDEMAEAFCDFVERNLS